MADPTMVDITIHYGGAAAALTVALALSAFDYVADAAREKSAAELAKIDRETAAAIPDDLALGAALNLIPPLRMAASFACDTGAFLLTLLTRTMEVILGWLWGSPGYFRTGRRLARVQTVRATIPSQAPPRHGKMLSHLLLPGPTAADIMFSYGRAAVAILLALKMFYCRRTACLVDNTARTCSAYAKRRLQANVALLERGEILSYYAQAIPITTIDGATTFFLRAIFHPLCFLWQIERVVFAWLANPGRVHPTEIYGRYIDGATTVASLLLEMGRRNFLTPVISLVMKLGLLLRGLLRLAWAMENAASVWLMTTGRTHLTKIYEGLVEGTTTCGLNTPPLQEKAIYTPPDPFSNDDAEREDIPSLTKEDDATVQLLPVEDVRREGLDPHETFSRWLLPTTSNLPVSISNPCRCLVRRRRHSDRAAPTQYKHTTTKRTDLRPRCKHLLPPSVTLLLLLRMMDKVWDVTCWGIARMPSYILPEDDVIKWL